VTAIENSVLETLQNLELAVASMGSTTPKPDLRPIFERLDELTRSLPPSTDPDLLHYLHKNSYQKARLFLEGREAENQAGQCRHV
jgi:hypothetical protein